MSNTSTPKGAGNGIPLSKSETNEKTNATRVCQDDTPLAKQYETATYCITQNLVTTAIQRITENMDVLNRVEIVLDAIEDVDLQIKPHSPANGFFTDPLGRAGNFVASAVTKLGDFASMCVVGSRYEDFRPVLFAIQAMPTLTLTHHDVYDGEPIRLTDDELRRSEKHGDDDDEGPLTRAQLAEHSHTFSVALGSFRVFASLMAEMSEQASPSIHRVDSVAVSQTFKLVLLLEKHLEDLGQSIEIALASRIADEAKETANG